LFPKIKFSNKKIINIFLKLLVILWNKCTNGFNKNIKKKKRKFIQNKQKKKKDIKKI